MKKEILNYTHLVCIIIYKEVLMKRRELIKKLQKAGFALERNGANHDIYSRGKDKEVIPRHSEINEKLARAILRKWNIK